MRQFWFHEINVPSARGLFVRDRRKIIKNKAKAKHNTFNNSSVLHLCLEKRFFLFKYVRGFVVIDE